MNFNNVHQSYDTLRDRDLVIACQHKNAEAFAALYKRYSLYARGVLRKLAPDMKQNYDDIIQDVFVRVWKSIGTIENASAFKSWLRRLITNVFYDELRAKKDFVVSLDDQFDDSDNALGDWIIADDKARPDECLERKEIVCHVKEALNMLPTQFRTVIILRELCGFSYEEIAATTKTEIGTVKSRVSRGRTKMQNRLMKYRVA